MNNLTPQAGVERGKAPSLLAINYLNRDNIKQIIIDLDIIPVKSLVDIIMVYNTEFRLWYTKFDESRETLFKQNALRDSNNIFINLREYYHGNPIEHINSTYFILNGYFSEIYEEYLVVVFKASDRYFSFTAISTGDNWVHHIDEYTFDELLIDGPVKAIQYDGIQKSFIYYQTCLDAENYSPQVGVKMG